MRSALSCVVWAFVSVAAATATGQPEARLLEPSDYGRFESIEDFVLSPDGRWLAVSLARVEGARALEVYDSNAASSEPVSIEQGATPEFSKDSSWLVYQVVPTESEADALRKKQEPVRNRAELRELASGDGTDLGEVESFALDEAGDFLALLRYRLSTSDDDAEEDERPTAELVVRDLASGRNAAFGHVAELAWQDAERGSLLAFVVETPGGTHSVQLYDPSDGRLQVLDSGEERYSGLAWREDASDLAVLRARTDEAMEGSNHDVLAWRNLAGDSSALAFRSTDVETVPSGMRIVEHRKPAWSGDGARLFFGIAPWLEKPPSSDEDEEKSEDEPSEEEPADVEVWHSKDERIIAMQRVRKSRDETAHLVAAWNLDAGRFVEIGDDLRERVEILEGGRFALQWDRDAYLVDNQFDRPRFDLDLIDAATGERTTIARAVQYAISGSATGRFVLYFQGGHYHAYDTDRGKTVNLTESVPASFVDEEYDTPVRTENPPWGRELWTDDDSRVLLHDRYDVWAVSPTGKDPVRLTDGASESVRHRALNLDDEAGGVDPATPLYMSLYGEWSKRSGFARAGLDGSGYERLVYRDKGLRSLRKADDAEVYAYVEESHDDSPDVFFGDPDLREARQVTRTNAFQSEFLWTRGELVDYESAWGKKLQGALYYPADYEPGRRYPMIVYVYERLSQNLHRYVVPSERRYYNPTVWTQQGYFVLMPDIAYRGRNPGPSAVDCVVPAVDAVLAKGLVDRDKVGLVGHSWGGYEASFIPTQTNLFAASVAGAPLTNFFSMFGTIHWSGGFPETSHFETGQARMEVPYWEDAEAYVRNSPVMFIQDLETPMLVFFGDEDGTVDFHQGVELYNYARRAGKHLVMLVYRGEDHGARQKKNQVDYHRRILQWFGHFLKGEPAELWITKGQTLLEREREIERSGTTPK